MTGSAETPRPIAAPAAWSIACTLVWMIGAAPAFAQPAATPRAGADGELLKKRSQELDAAKAERDKAAEAERKLRAEIDTLGDDRRRFNQALIDSAANIRSFESRLAANEARLAPLEQQEAALRDSLSQRRAVIAEVLASLQRMGRQPPPAILVSPEDALRSIRTAILLGAVLPEMRAKAQQLAAELAELVRIRKDIAAERERLTVNIASLTAERERLTALIDERNRRQAEAIQALETERKNAIALARQVDSLQDLIARMEQGIDAAAKAAREAARAPAAPKAGERPDLAALKDPGRLMPAIAFAAARGHLPFPVNGVRIRDFGAADGLGGTEKGLLVATRPGAQVTAPCDGWVVYAGPFRSYGQLLILNAGGGYHVLLAGMERITVDLGQFVLTGEPVAVMGSGTHVVAAAPVGSSQSVLYVEFRKDGTPVDPGPWWAAGESEKVRG